MLMATFYEKGAIDESIEAYMFGDLPDGFDDRLCLVEPGEAIVPHLIIEIQKKDMKKKGYAILALGKIKDKRALPVLIEILDDRSESIYIRDDALRAIWHIDRRLGEQYVTKFSGQSPDMDRTIVLLREGRI
jgi:hypothetical protein